MNTPRIHRVVVASALVAGLLTGCGGDEPGDWIRVLTPEPGAEVHLPFEVRLEASVPLGPPATQLHHAHIWFGDNQENYLVVESETVMVTNAPAGDQEMHVTLHFANHTPAGPEDTVRLLVADGPGSDPSEEPASDIGY